MCAPVLLEILYSARSPAQYRALAVDLAGLPLLEATQATHTLALRTQEMLADRSQHRGPTPTDLIVAAIAESHGVTLLHYDRHYEVIARVTGQPTRWLARRGSLG